MYTYMLAGEDLELARADLQGFLKSQGIGEKPEHKSKISISEAEPGQLRRLALTHEVTELIDRGSLEDVKTGYRPENSFAVRAIDVEKQGFDTKKYEKKLGSILETEANEVDLERPDEALRLYLFEDEYVIGRLVLDINRSLFDKRKNQNRPFSSPVSLDPVTARILVNLSEVPPGGHILDPFCGTGGVLIEAGLCGIGVHGRDIQQEMVSGARKNLEEYGVIVHDVKKSDISELDFDRQLDAVVTDLPYGKSSKSENEPVEKFVEKWSELGRKAVFMYNKPEIAGMEHEHSIYVHGSMTRYIFIQDSS